MAGNHPLRRLCGDLLLIARPSVTQQAQRRVTDVLRSSSRGRFAAGSENGAAAAAAEHGAAAVEQGGAAAAAADAECEVELKVRW